MAHYSLSFTDPAGHLIDVEMTLAVPVADQRIAMPSWIPGSYLMREFARNVVTLSASQSGAEITATKVDKSTWQLACDAGSAVTVRYRVYAWDRSVRGCYFDVSRGFVNPAASLMQNLAAPDGPCTLELHAPAEDWRCATSMTPHQVDARGFGSYSAASYDELIDHPIECGDFDEFSFEAGGVPHRFVISGRHRGDLARLRADSQKICQGHCDLFSNVSPSRAPFDHYVFQLHVVDDGYGGLEHRASTALISPRSDLPSVGDASVSEGYRDLLGLISHEYFHSWNVKRIKPAAFTPYDTHTENYTRLLWLFEGFTSYYDDLMVKRVGLVTEADYLKVLGRRLTQLLRAPGAQIQSAADASFDAWIKYYRPDENAVNNQISYYDKGEIVNMMLDITIRTASGGAKSEDDVMRYLYNEYFKKLGRGYTSEEFQKAAELMAGKSLDDFFAKYVRGTAEIDYSGIMNGIGLQITTREANPKANTTPDNPATGRSIPAIGADVADVAGVLTIRTITAGTPAYEQGLNTGDQIVAIDGYRATQALLQSYIGDRKAKDKVKLTIFRFDKLREVDFTLGSNTRTEYEISPIAAPTDDQKKLYHDYLKGDL